MSRDRERDDRRNEEVLQILDGTRGASSKASVRRGDLMGLGNFDAPSSAGANPTKAEFDALREQVLRLHTLLANAGNKT